MTDLAKRKLTRRDFLKILAALGIGYVGYKVFDYNYPKCNVKAKILIVGGGAAGISMAARLQRQLSDPDITIIDPSETHFYQPGFTLIGGGVYQANDVTKNQTDCIPSGVKWIKDKVLTFDPDHNKVSSQSNGVLEYDFLVLCTGLQMNFDKIEGLTQADLGKGNAHCIYDYQGAQKCFAAIQDLSKKGGKAIFSDTWTKLKCGGAPKKINMLAEAFCRKEKTRDRVDFEFISSMKDMFDVPFYRTRLEEIYQERNIPISFKQQIRSVDTSAKVVTFEDASGVFTKHNYDFLHIVPPMSAPSCVIESPLSWNAKTSKQDDWVPTNKDTLVHDKYKNIIVLGDVSNLPTSKTGAAIRIQVPVAVSNLFALMEQKTPSAIYNGYTACPFVTEFGKVLMAEFGYDKQPMPSVPFVDASHEQWIFWIMKVYLLKPMYFNGMLKGRM